MVKFHALIMKLKYIYEYNKTDYKKFTEYKT